MNVLDVSTSEHKALELTALTVISVEGTWGEVSVLTAHMYRYLGWHLGSGTGAGTSGSVPERPLITRYQSGANNPCTCAAGK